MGVFLRGLGEHFSRLRSNIKCVLFKSAFMLRLGEVMLFNILRGAKFGP